MDFSQTLGSLWNKIEVWDVPQFVSDDIFCWKWHTKSQGSTPAPPMHVIMNWSSFTITKGGEETLFGGIVYIQGVIIVYVGDSNEIAHILDSQIATNA